MLEHLCLSYGKVTVVTYIAMVYRTHSGQDNVHFNCPSTNIRGPSEFQAESLQEPGTQVYPQLWILM